MDRASLSLEQAPPIQVPFRFFLTAPLFALLSALLLLGYGPELLLSRWSPLTLAFTHLLTLGFLGLIMCGAMLQMLPVLAGSPVPAVSGVSMLVHLLLSIGTLAMGVGFISGAGALLKAAVILLGTGFAVFAGALGVALLRAKLPNPTVTGMRLALGALVATVALGMILGSNLVWPIGLSRPLLFTDIHLLWGVLGWVALLVIGVAFQVVPMFQMTPDYPQWMTRFLVRVLFLGLCGWTLFLLADPGGAVIEAVGQLWILALLVGYGLFALTTLQLQRRRKRRLPDVTLLFWRTGMLSVMACLALWVGAGVFPQWARGDTYPLLLGGGLLLGFAFSVVNGMLYKIVPFLSWFHLQHRKVTLLGGAGTRVPNMKEFLPDHLARRQLWGHLATLFLLGPAILWPGLFARPAGLAFTLSCVLLMYNLLQASVRYRSVSRVLTKEIQAAEGLAISTRISP